MILIPFSLLFPLIILARKFLYLDDEDGHGGDVHGGEAELPVLKLGETNTGMMLRFPRMNNQLKMVETSKVMSLEVEYQEETMLNLWFCRSNVRQRWVNKCDWLRRLV